MPRKNASCVHETRIMTNGMKATCIAYRLAKDIDVQFEDGTIIEHVQKCHFFEGKIANPNSEFNPHIRLQSLEETNSDLLKEWDYTKNEISPKEITRSYNKSVWWICGCGHSWSAKVSARTRRKPTGCPYCCGNLPIEGVNDFATVNPELMMDWNYDKNANINPSKITAHSSILVDWKCHFCGHEWRTSVHSRSTAKSGCPNCSMKSTSFGEQAVYFYVKKVFPDAINRYHEGRFELDIYIPSINIGIEFDGAYFHNNEESLDREKRKNQKCQELGIKLIRIKDSSTVADFPTSNYCIISVDNLKDKANLNTIIRLLMRELDPESNPWTRQNPRQIWSTIDHTIDVNKDFFDIVADKYIRETDYGFTKSNPQLLEDWDYELNQNINPNSLTKGCSWKINWKCHICGFKWKARIPDRLKGSGCPCCRRNVLVTGVNDFATLYPEELKEWDYAENRISPTEVISNNEKISWICSTCGNKWVATINDKVIRKDKTGCPQCANTLRALKRHRRAMNNGGLFDKYPELLEQWDFNKNEGVDINDISSGSSKKYWWVCKECGHTWESSPNNRTHGNHVRNCPQCRYKIIAEKKRKAVR